ncbi:MAG: cob(I)yrinic acid a,c-diamide adenosyltransferase [Pseudomonadota bacterium]
MADDDRHKKKMENRKAAQDAKVADKTIKKGLLIVHTGKGKGKSTCAWGLMLRALGRGNKVGVVQFGKGAWETGEREAVKAFGDRVIWHTLGEGFTWETQDRERDVAAAEKAWSEVEKLIADPTIDMVICDELNISLRYDHLDLAKVLDTLNARPPEMHVVVTGRNAKPDLIEAADLVTEMTPIKHHFAAGVGAQEGIEF